MMMTKFDYTPEFSVDTVDMQRNCKPTSTSYRYMRSVSFSAVKVEVIACLYKVHVHGRF